MTDSYIRVPPDAGGKKVDALELTNDNGDTVERLRMSVPEGVSMSGAYPELILHALKVNTRILAQTFGVNIVDTEDT